MGENRSGQIFDAFISYRHTEPDKIIAEKLHRMLETFKVPKAIKKKGSQKKVGKIFRDREELPTSSNLADSIQAALENSEHLIVICSPRACESQWVIKEIETFSALHGHDRILALLVEGEPYESFPEPLRFVKRKIVQEDGNVKESIIEVEPLAADIRDKSIRGMKKKLKTEVLRLLAPILNCGYDDLKQRHRERAIKRIVTVSLSLALFFLSFGTFTAYQSYVIKQQSEVVKEQAEQVRQQSEQLKEQIKKTLAGQSLYLSDVSARLLKEGDRRRSILVALEALPENLDTPERPYLEEAEFALGEALQVYKNNNMFVPDIALHHDKAVNFIKLSPDAKTAVTSSTDGYLYFWETGYGKLIDKYYTGETYLKDNELYFVDEKSIICFTDRGVFRLDTESMGILWEHDYRAKRFAYMDKMVGVLGESIILLDADSGEKIMDCPIEDFIGFFDGISVYSTFFDFSSTGKYLSAGNSIGDVIVLDIKGEALKWAYDGHYDDITDVDVSDDGRVAIASRYVSLEDPLGKGTGYLEIYDSNKRILEMNFDYSSIERLYFHPLYKNLLLFTEAEKIDVLNIDTKRMDYTFIHGDRVSEYLVSEDFVFSSSYDGTIRAWVMRSGGFESDAFRITLPEMIDCFETYKGVFAVSFRGSNNAMLLRNLYNEAFILLEGHNDSIQNAVFSPDGSRFLTYSYGLSEIFLWDTHKKELIGSIKEADGLNFRSAAFTEGAKRVLCLPDEGAITVYDANTLKPLYEKDTSYVYDYWLSPDGSLCFIENIDMLEVVNTSDLSVVNTYPDLLSIDKLAVFKDNNRVVYTQTGKKPAVMEISTGKILYEFNEENVSDVFLSNDNKTIAFIYEDNSIHLFDADSCSELIKINDFQNKAEKVIFDPMDNTIFVGLDDNSVRLYGAKTGVLLNALKGLDSRLGDIIYNRDNTLYITRGEYQDAIIWSNDTNKKLARISHLDGVSPDFDYLVSGRTDNTIVLMPRYNLRMLMDEAQKQLGGVTLSEKEKRDLFIE